METITEKIPEAKFMPKILGWWVVAHEILVTAQTSMCLDRVLVKENQKEGETETITQRIPAPISTCQSPAGV